MSSFVGFGSWQISLVEHSHSSSALVVLFVCRWWCSSFFRWRRRGLLVGGLDRWRLGSLLRLTSVGHPRKLTPSRAKGVGLMWEKPLPQKLCSIFWSALLASTCVNLIHCTQTIITTFPLKYQGIVCLCVVFAHSCFIENPLIWSWEMYPSFWRWFCNKGVLARTAVGHYRLKSFAAVDILQAKLQPQLTRVTFLE
jgi:hypothetical protein